MKNSQKRGSVFLFSAARLMAFVFFCFASISTFASENKGFRVDFIDVGQGDASLVTCDGRHMLIDGGKAKKSDLIYSYLKQRSADHLDYIVATHPDEDHIGGLAGALNYATTDMAFSPVKEHETKTFDNFLKYLNKRNSSITIPKAGDVYKLGSSTMTVLGPTRNSSDSNNNSIVLKVAYGKNSFLFTGDAEEDEEKDILSSGRSIKCDVLKVGHHGSSSSTTYRFLREAEPEYAVISVGKDNSYGHPTEETLSRLRDADVKVYRTDMQGDVICTSDGTKVTFKVQKNADADTLSGAGAGQKEKAPNGVTNAPQGASNGSPQTKTNEDSVATTQPAPQPAEVTQVASTNILNTNTKKFHYPTCNSVKQMKEKNKKEFKGTRDETIGQGYEPCKNCNP